MAQKVPTGADAARDIGEAGGWGDREGSDREAPDLVLGLLDAVLAE
jgi:hypothetical protein